MAGIEDGLLEVLGNKQEQASNPSICRGFSFPWDSITWPPERISPGL